MSSDLDIRILEAWDGDMPEPRSPDPLFRIAVMQKIEREVYRRNLTLVVLAGLAGSVLFWLALPRIVRALADASLPSSAVLGIAVAFGLAAAAWGTNRVYRFV